MANTTFSGPVRSENGFKLTSKTAATGVVHDRTQISGLMDARRKYLYEPFYKDQDLMRSILLIQMLTMLLH